MQKKREVDIDEMYEIQRKKKKMNANDIEERIGVVQERKERTNSKIQNKSL